MKKFNIHQLLAFTTGLLILAACNGEPEKQAERERPYEVWVSRSVLDKKPRMLSVALHDKLWIAYNTQTASLYKAWLGQVNFDGPVYTTAHGPQPTSTGITYMEEPDENPWRIILNDGKEVFPEVNYKGHAFINNQITLKYELVFNGQTIHVEETPEYVATEGEKVGFERKFSTSGVPADIKVTLNMSLSSILNDKEYKGNTEFIVSNKKVEAIGGQNFLLLDGTLALESNGTTTFVVIFSPKLAMPAEKQGENNAEEMVLNLMARSDCNTCHNLDVKTVGPSYTDIAKRYPNNAQVKAELIGKIINGGAGSWGDVPMTPHPDLSKEDAAKLVSYVLNLDAREEKEKEANKLMPKPDYDVVFTPVAPGMAGGQEEKKGIAVNIYRFDENVIDFPKINDEMLPVKSGILNAIHTGNGDFSGLQESFAVHATGFINMEETTNVVFRLISDDGSRLFINNELVLDHGGSHAMIPKDGEYILKKGRHPFLLEYFQGGGGKGLSLQWRPYSADEFKVVPPEVFTFLGNNIKKTQEAPIVIIGNKSFSGDATQLRAVHPAFDLYQARPNHFQPKVGGMDFLSDGRMVISTWDSLGSVYILDGVKGKNPESIKVKRIAFGLAEPLGLKVVDDEIYVLQKQELTKLVDLNNDDIIDEYQTVCNGWKVSANFHEFAFGLVFEEGYFYGTLATAINPGGASTQPQIPDRGKVLKISKEDGSFELIASGLRTPNGIGYGVDQEIFIADNQGDWLPASKIVHLQPEAWYGSRSVDFKGTEGLTETLPLVWLPQNEIGNSPSQPAVLNVGPYKNQMIHGEVTHGGIKRVFAEKVNGAYQGVVFRFSQGLEAGVNRLTWGPDGALYVGGVGSTGNWGQTGKLKYGLQKLVYNGKSVFEMLAVRALPNGVEIEFTEPLKQGTGTEISDYNIRQWWYKPTAEYGGPKLDDKILKIKKITVSDDRRKVELQLDEMKPQHVVYIRLKYETMKSEGGANLWTTEAWYNMNNIPSPSETHAGILSSK